MHDLQLRTILSEIREELESDGYVGALEIIDKEIREVESRLSRCERAGLVSVKDRQRCLQAIGEVLRLLDLIGRWF